MIITLAKANFSAKNIGLLNGFSILTNLGMGAIYEGPSSVAINGTLSGSITLEEGYKYTNIEVLMDGQVISNGVEVNGNTVELEITGVKGNITINIATVTYVEPVLFASMAYQSSVNNSLAPNAYVANIPYQVYRNNYVDFIDIGVAKQSSKTKVAEPGITVSDVTVYVFDAETNQLKEIVVDKQAFTTTYSDLTDEYILRVPINKEFDYDCYFGYSCTRNAQGYGLAYYSNANCYLSGTPFDYETVYAPTSGAVGIVSWIYGTAAMVIPPDGYTDVVTCALNASQALASNCYVGGRNTIIPAGQKFDRIDIVTVGAPDAIEGLNVVAVNANTNELLEYLATEMRVPTVQNTDHTLTVARIDDLNKQYDVPVYLLFNGTRKISGVGIAMTNSNKDGILLVDDNGSPAIGSIATETSTSANYNVGHIVAVKEVE